jgi:hypothetical protein
LEGGLICAGGCYVMLVSLRALGLFLGRAFETVLELFSFNHKLTLILVCP